VEVYVMLRYSELVGAMSCRIFLLVSNVTSLIYISG
jgi:hypothetical protein